MTASLLKQRTDFLEVGVILSSQELNAIIASHRITLNQESTKISQQFWIMRPWSANAYWKPVMVEESVNLIASSFVVSIVAFAVGIEQTSPREAR